jgi:3-oxoacyl-[acyl-carrier protein] reductase
MREGVPHKRGGNCNALGGKVILVTGAGRGIGRAIALSLAQAGADIMVHYNRNEKEALSLLRETGGKKEERLFKADLSKKEGVLQLARNVEERTGKLYGIVNNAGIYSGSGLSEMSFREWENVINTNLRAVIFLIKGLSHQLKKNRGCVVNISSILGLVPDRGAYAYQASKAALSHITKGLAMELAPEVRVNSVAPGFVMTDLNRAGWRNPDFRKRVEMDTPLGRWGKPSDIAGPVRFLLSDEASFITGQTLLVDGGKGLL